MTAVGELVLYVGCLPATPFREYIAAAAAAGFDAVTVWPLTYRRAISREGLDPATMRTIAEDAGLRITDVDSCGDWVPAPEVAMDVPTIFRSLWKRPDFFDAAENLGADTIVAVHITGGDLAHDVAVEGFGRLCDEAAEHGLRVALEFLPFSGIPDLPTAWSVVRDVARPNGGLVLDVCHLRRSRWDGGTLSSIPPDRIFGIQLGDGPTEAPADLREEAMFHRMLPGEGAFSVADVLGRLTELGVRAPIGPELYQRIWSERPAQEVASDLMAATRAVLSAKIG
jgi:sugar phosphate isomerase/epimerase